MKETTQVYLREGSRYLMLHRVKKENDMNEGKWIAAGGKLEPGETADACAVREILEETGYLCLSLRKRAEVLFLNDVFENEKMHIYTCDDFKKEAEPVSDEGVLEWIEKDEIWNLNLWEGDRAFLRKILDDEDYFEMKLVYSGYELLSVE